MAEFQERDVGGAWITRQIKAGEMFVTRSRTPYEVRFQSPPRQQFENLSLHIATLFSFASSIVSVGRVANLLLLPALMIGTYLTVCAIQRFSKNAPCLKQVSGRIALSVLLVFTGAAHFLKKDEMAQMVPAFFPNPGAVIVVTGFLELAAAFGLLSPKAAPVVGKLLVVFFVAIFPANIYAAINHVDFGGHSEGIPYLILRFPLQVFFIVWTWWFTFRHPKVSNPL